MRSDMFLRRFIFGGEDGGACGEQGAVHVSAEDLYTAEKGFGFVTERNRRKQALLQLPELNSAFDTVYWYRNEDLSCVEEDAFGCWLDSEAEIGRLEREAGEPFWGERRRIPLSFKLDVPRQGNYKVTVTIRGIQSRPFRPDHSQFPGGGALRNSGTIYPAGRLYADSVCP